MKANPRVGFLFMDPGVCANYHERAAEMESWPVSGIIFMQHIRVLHLEETIVGRANRQSCRFVVKWFLLFSSSDRQILAVIQIARTDSCRRK